MEEKQNSKLQLWSGRFSQSSSHIMEQIGESISFDKKLYTQDIKASKAHSRMLEKIGILNQTELSKVLDGLEKIEDEIETNQFKFSFQKEDIHMHIESRLIELIGDTGKKIHTGRSRNDQVAQDVRLYISENIEKIQVLIYSLLEIIYQKAEKSVDIFMPGYTHLQVAQPIRVSHYLLSYFWMFKRDFDLFSNTFDLNSELVLGSGAMAGVNYSTDREFLKKNLGLNKISENSIDAVSSRDNFFHFLFACSQFMIHASRFCEEVIIYSSVEFSFIKLPDSLTTGSSIMPQKKNPDIAELIRGKTARVISNLNHIMMLVKSLPLAYNRDLQEDKIALFDSCENTVLCIEAISAIFKEMVFIKSNMESSLKKGFSTATDLADFLVLEKNVPFRQAHQLVGSLVQECVKLEQDLHSIDEDTRKSISEYFVGDDYFKAISMENSCDKKKSHSSTSMDSQTTQLKLAKDILNELTKIIKRND